MKNPSEDTLYILDTHVLIWYFTGSKRLHKKLKENIDTTRARGGRLLVPTIVLSESLDIAEKGRVELDFTKMYNLVQEEAEFEIVGFGVDIFDKTLDIKEIKEIHDRIIAATARFYKAGVLTKDQIICASGEVKVL